MKFKLTKDEKKWVMYDVGNSAFTLMISTILPIYFNYLAGNAGRKFDSSINQKTLTGPIKPVFFCQF